MKWNIFERKTATEIKKHTTPLDVEAMWQSVLPELQQKKKRPPIFLLTFGGLILASFIVAYVLVAPAESKLVSTIKEKQDIAIVSNKTKSNLDFKTSLPIEKKEIKTKNQTLVQRVKKTPTKKDILTAKGFVPTTSKSKLKELNVLERPAHLDYNKTVSQTKSIFQNSSDLKKSDVFKLNNSIGKQIPVELKPLLTNINSYELAIKPTFQFIEVEKTTIHKSPIFAYSLGLKSGIGMSNKNLSTTSETSDDFTALKEKSETSLETFNFGIILRVRHKSKFYLSAGLAYKRINERINIKDDFTLIGTDPDAIIEIYTDQNGDQLYSTGSLTKETSIGLNIIHYNSHQIVSVPLSLAYEFNLKSLRVSPEIGINMNLKNISKGKTISGNSYVDLIDVEDKDYYKNNLGLSYTAAFNINYLLSSKYEIGIAPYYEYNPNSFTISSAAISEYYNRVGVNLNLMYTF